LIGLLSKYQYEKKNKADFVPFPVGEYWSGPDEIDNWLNGVAGMTDNQIAAFDFPVRYKLKDVCDTPNYDLRNLTDGASVSAARPLQCRDLHGKSRHGRERSGQ
jgi:alpha-amylase